VQQIPGIWIYFTKMILALIVILLVLCLVISVADVSVFFLGDSVSQRTFMEGFVPLCDCQKDDPAQKFIAERTNHYINDTGRICTAKGVIRIGYMIHFGVFLAPFHRNWPSHNPIGATNDSRTNIKLAIREFQNRTIGTEGPVLFIMLSSMWDIMRYNENTNLYSNIQDWENQFQDEYTTLMVELRKMMRFRDELIISTMHRNLYEDVIQPNVRTRRVARHLRLPVFDQEAMLTGRPQSYLQDLVHQDEAHSKILAESILARNFTVFPECDL
jgi:hypothetical protein